MKDNYIVASKQEMTNIAASMIRGSIGLIEGCRRIVSLASSLGIKDDPVFLVFIGVDSETDEFPIGKVRDYYNKENLQKLDIELMSYLEKMRPALFEACNELIEKYSITKPA